MRAWPVGLIVLGVAAAGGGTCYAMRPKKVEPVEVVGLHVVDDRHCGVEREERLVVLVGLDHEELVAVDQSVSAPGRDPPARQSRGMQAGRGQGFGGHDRRGGLSVGA